MGDEPELTGLPSLIPEIYYDLIARVPPGTMLFLAVCVLGGGLSVNALAAANVGSATLLLLLIVAAGYSVGILITPIGSAVHRRYRYSVWRLALGEQDYTQLVRGLDERFTLGFGSAQERFDAKNLDLKQIDLLDRVMHDYLKGAHPQAKVILPKMRAEAALCDHLLVAFLGTAATLAYALIDRGEGIVEHWGLIVVIGIACLVADRAGRYRNKRLIHRQFSYLTVLQGSK